MALFLPLTNAKDTQQVSNLQLTNHAGNKVFPHGSTDNRQFAVVNPGTERIGDVPNWGEELMQYIHTYM